MKQNREKLQTFCRYILLGFLILWGINHTVYAQEIDNFVSFNPGRASFKIKNFETVETYQIGKKKIAVGYYLSKDGKPTRPDTENDYGYRLVMVNEKNKIEYRSRGAMDVMKYRPFFYKNKSGKILIFCTLSFEYAAGAEVFLIREPKDEKHWNIGYRFA